jgi:hypothetical protein
MSLYRELRDALPFDPAERDGLWGYREADEPNASRLGLAAGAIVALGLATGLGIAPAIDWAAALFCGLIAAVFTRGILLIQHRLRHGGWRAWRRRTVNVHALDLVSGGTGVALALLLATGAGGIGPAFDLGVALFVGILAVIASRAILLVARWP